MPKAEERNLKLVLEYDGANYFGFQKQTHHPTVQAEIENALSRLFNKRTSIGAASGRTDTGVHASHQVVHVHTENQLQCNKICRALNGLLPRDIAVKSVEEKENSFHARYGAKSKTYEYLIYNAKIRSPLLSSSTYHVSDVLSIMKMREAARVVTGKHDFASFCGSHGAGKNRENTIRTVSKLSISKRDQLIRIKISADGFLYHMVRNLVSALVEVGRGRLSKQDLKRILKARKRTLAPKTAPGHALSLVDVTY